MSKKMNTVTLLILALAFTAIGIPTPGVLGILACGIGGFFFGYVIAEAIRKTK